MPDPQKLLATIRRAATLFRATPGRKGGIISPTEIDDILVVGDLHGHLETFGRALKLAALDKHPRRHLVLQELIHDPRIDADVDPDRSHRLVDVVCVLKCQYPDRVHLILGNHELSELTGRPIIKNNVPLNEPFRRGVEATYGSSSGEAMTAYHELFAALPLMVRLPNRVLILHTLPDGPMLDRLDLAILDAWTWPAEATARGGTIYALTWGRDTEPATADRFARMIDADLFITGHQPCDDGFAMPNHRTLIIDGTDPLPMACLIDARRPLTVADLVAGLRSLAEPA